MSERKIFSLDRVEGELAVCISDDDDIVIVKRDTLSEIEVRDVFSAESDGESLVNIVPMPEERDRRLDKNRSRLHALAKRSKK